MFTEQMLYAAIGGIILDNIIIGGFYGFYNSISSSSINLFIFKDYSLEHFICSLIIFIGIICLFPNAISNGYLHHLKKRDYNALYDNEKRREIWFTFIFF